MFPAFRSRVAGLSLLWLDLARQRRDITQRHPWLPQAMHSPRALGPNTLRYINYFLGLLRRTGLDTAAKMELLGLVNGFALSYGGVQAHWPRNGPAPVSLPSSRPPPWCMRRSLRPPRVVARNWPRRWPGRPRRPGRPTRCSAPHSAAASARPGRY